MLFFQCNDTKYNENNQTKNEEKPASGIKTKNSILRLKSAGEPFRQFGG